MGYPNEDGWRKYINEYFAEYYRKMAEERTKQDAFNSFFDIFCTIFTDALKAIDKHEPDAWEKALALLRHPGIREILYNLPDELWWAHFPNKGKEAFAEDLRRYVDDYQSELLERILGGG